MLSRADLAEMVADLELSEAAVLAVADPWAELAWLEAGIEGAPDAEERRKMAEELRGMLREVG